MKRVVALALCMLMTILALVSCNGSIEPGAENRGDVFNAYITGDIPTFDPGKDFTDESAVKILGMIYEGLFRLDENGKVQNALAEKVNIIEDDTKGEYIMQITLRETKWSDGNALTADDFVYAWKRIMKQGYESQAAALLYDVKNARAAKAGDVSIDELGVSAPNAYLLEISFEGKIDYENFKKNLASLALVPLRETAVAADESNWARRHATLVTNGPFAIKMIDLDENTIRIERNAYYYRDTVEDMLDRYVVPYRINVTFVKDDAAKLANKVITEDNAGFYGKYFNFDPEENTATVKFKAPDDLEAIYAQFVAGEIFYMGDVPLSKRAELEKDAHVTDANSTYSYIFNTENELFADARVRKALSMAIDRQAIAAAAVYADPATGLIANTVYNNFKGDSFRDVHGDVLSVTADVAGAKALLKEAGVNGGTFTLAYRQNEVEQVIAEAVAKSWGELGFKVNLTPLAPFAIDVESTTQSSGFVTVYVDGVQAAYEAREFDVLALDISMLGTDAFAPLAVYATELSGNGIDLTPGANNAFKPHKTGFSDADYDAIIDRALAEKDTAKRADILAEAEKHLMEKMPVMPVVFNKSCYLISDEIEGLETSYLGYPVFNEVSYPGFVYVPENGGEAAAATTAAAK
ncbi:MAG: peptide ABC transporter substrate-binding protein [Clostridia bacterium]|nr:peptide ABC transporter substrate-binding protein [Clostridia bacterium]